MIPVEILDGAHVAIVSGIVWSVLCRARYMTERTLWRVRLQHGLLNAAAIMSLVVRHEWSAPVLAAGVMAYLALGAYRWSGGAPAGTIDQSDHAGRFSEPANAEVWK